MLQFVAGAKPQTKMAAFGFASVLRSMLHKYVFTSQRVASWAASSCKVAAAPQVSGLRPPMASEPAGASHMSQEMQLQGGETARTQEKQLQGGETARTRVHAADRWSRALQIDVLPTVPEAHGQHRWLGQTPQDAVRNWASAPEPGTTRGWASSRASEYPTGRESCRPPE